jgi:transcriptional regulator with PAS, ATPase and Fis domain
LEVCKTVPAVGIREHEQQKGNGQTTEQFAVEGPVQQSRPPANAQNLVTNPSPALYVCGGMRDAVLASWIAEDPTSKQLLSDVQRIAPTSTTVLIRGEGGTGKKLLALLLHSLSSRATRPIVHIDCANLGQTFLETELFGCEAGAIPGLAGPKPGQLELAGSGTVVLNEVAALSLPLQAKLLRAIEDQRTERVGGNRSVEVKATIIALTSVDLEQAMARHAFRKDLYYRLNVVPIAIRPLRERRQDINALVEHFLGQALEVHKQPRMKFTQDTFAALAEYDYPGNVRELRQIVERAVLSATPPEIQLDDLPWYLRHANGAPQMSLEELERHHIVRVLEHTRGKKTQAARILGISRKTLLEKRKRYNLG